MIVLPFTCESVVRYIIVTIPLLSIGLVVYTSYEWVFGDGGFLNATLAGVGWGMTIVCSIVYFMFYGDHIGLWVKRNVRCKCDNESS